jgi:hypothetical protein
MMNNVELLQAEVRFLEGDINHSQDTNESFVAMLGWNHYPDHKYYNVNEVSEITNEEDLEDIIDRLLAIAD